MSESLKNKRVLVTGASTGLGAAMARLFASSDAVVGIHYATSREAAENLCAEIERDGGRAACFQSDLTEESAPRKLFERFLETFGGIEVLVNNAGAVIVPAHFLELEAEAWERTLRLNLVAPALLAGHAFAFMRDHGGGRIINVSSVSAKFGGSASSLHYSAAKAGLEALTKGLAREGAPYNILVNAIRPGYIQTPFHAKFPKADPAARIEMIPLKRAGQSEDVARMALFLASEGGNFITGEIFSVSGGE